MALCHVKGDESDHVDGRDIGDGELLIMANIMVNMMVMLVVMFICLTVAITTMMNLVKCWSL